MTAQIIQGSADWFAARLGKVTASRVCDVVAKTKSGPAASRANYMAQLIAERLTGSPGETFTNAAMAWGTEKEPEARNAYAFLTGAAVQEVGFIAHPSIPMTGASPDGLVGEEGLVEIKAPNTATHIETLLRGTIPEKYATQMLWQMACTGRAYCDFVSYDPRLPVEMATFIKRMERDDSRVGELEAEVVAFLAEIDAKIAGLQAAIARAA